MLITPGDLIPVQPTATTIPWTRRKSQILNFLHRGPVTFSTLVYDTNVGDISALSTYFNPERISVKDLNSRFGQHPSSGENSRDDNVKVGSENVLKPRLLLYPEHNLNHSQVKVQRTLKWVLSHQDNGEPDYVRPSSASELHPFSRSPPSDPRAVTNDGNRAVEPHGRIQTEFNSSARNLTVDNLNRSQGHRMPRPVSAGSSNPRLTPIGEPPIKDQFSIYDTEIRANTMPNLGSALDSVWREVTSGTIESMSGTECTDPDYIRWGGWKPTETAW